MKALSPEMPSLAPIILSISLLIHHPSAGSDVQHEPVNPTDDTSKSDEMPASVVLILLFMFSSLALICIRHVRREFAQQQKYLSDKSMGAILNRNLSRKSYGSTVGPQLDSSNIDQYIDDSLYGNWWFLDRVDHYVRSVQHVIVEWLEKPRPPVCFEVNPDRTVEAYNKNPEIPRNPNYVPRPFQHSENYSPATSPTLQKMFKHQHQINQKRKESESRDSVEEEKEYDDLESISGRSTRSNRSSRSNRSRRSNDGIVNRMNERISLKHQMEYDDFNDYGRYSADNEYDEIVDDSDRELSDEDNGNGMNRNNRNVRNSKAPLKVVVLDLD